MDDKKQRLVECVQNAQMKRKCGEENARQLADKEFGAYIKKLRERIRRKGGLR